MPGYSKYVNYGFNEVHEDEQFSKNASVSQKRIDYCNHPTNNIKDKTVIWVIKELPYKV